jgi:hypothetical protein
MKRRNSTQIITPKMAVKSIRWPLILSGATPIESTIRITAATSTGQPTTMARKTVRRDHSISPSDNSKTRQAPRMNPFIASPGT